MKSLPSSEEYFRRRSILDEYKINNSEESEKNKKRWKSWFSLKILKDFCNETSIHGFNHIVAPKRHILEKIGWAAATILAALGALQLCLEQWQRYVASPTVVSLEKDYRTWNNTFPALTGCSAVKFIQGAAITYILNTWDVKEDDEKFDFYMRFVQTVMNESMENLDGFKNFSGDPNLDKIDLIDLVSKVGSYFKHTATWFESKINVTFVNVLTELGLCYSINSVVSKNQAVVLISAFNHQPYSKPITCQYVTHPCYMRIEVQNLCTNYYVHSPFEIVDMSTNKLTTVCPGQDLNTNWKVVETKASEDVRTLGIDQRKCRYHTEPASNKQQDYSGGVCRRECRNRLALKLCGCRPFFYFQEEGKVCNVTGMACLANHKSLLIKLDSCKCLPQCVDATYELTTQTESKWAGPFAARSSLKVGIIPPRSRYRRQILFCFEDLVVSFGGAAGLFLGCSFLSAIEIVYFILERFTMCILRWLGLQKKDDGKEKVDNTRKRKVLNIQEIRDGERYEMKKFIKNIAEYE